MLSTYLKLKHEQIEFLVSTVGDSIFQPFTVAGSNQGAKISRTPSNPASCPSEPSLVKDFCEQGRISSGALQHLIEQECTAYCLFKTPVFKDFNQEVCNEYCPAPYIENTITITQEQLDFSPSVAIAFDHYTQKALVHVPLLVEGQYCLTVSYSSPYSESFFKQKYIRVACSSSKLATVEASDVQFMADPNRNPTLIQLTGSVDNFEAVKSISWEFIPPIDNNFTFPTLINAGGLHPKFYASGPGTYKVQMVVYDGCKVYRKNVTVSPICTPGLNMAPQKFISGPTKLLKSGGTFPAVGLSLWPTTAKYLWKTQWEMDFDGLATRLSQEVVSANTIMLYKPEVVVAVTNSSSKTLDPVVNLGAVSTNNQAPPILNHISGKYYYGVRVVQKLQTTTTSISTENTLYRVISPRENYCRAIFSGTASYYSLTLQEMKLGGCDGLLRIKATTSDGCGSATDVFGLRVGGCGASPRAIIDGCNLTPSATCTKYQVRKIGEAKKLVTYDYVNRRFDSLPLSAYESYDPLFRSLSYTWTASSTPSLESSFANTLITSPSARTASFRPSTSGTWTVRLSVFNTCSRAMTEMAVIAECTELCDVDFSTVNATAQTIQLSSSMPTVPPLWAHSPGTSSCPKLSFWRWAVITFPDLLSDITFRSIYSVSAPPVQSLTSSASVSTFTFSPVVEGVYELNLQVSDGCITANRTKTLTVTCESVYELQMPAIPPQVSDDVGEFYEMTITPTLVSGALDNVVYHWRIRNPLGQLVSDPSLNVTDSAVTFTPSSPGQFNVTLYTYNGCRARKYETTVTARYPALTVSPMVSLSVYQTKLGSGPINIAWSPNDTTTLATFTRLWTLTKPVGSTASINMFTYRFTPDVIGTYRVQLILTNAAGTNFTALSDTLTVAFPYYVSLSSPISTIAVVSNENGTFPNVVLSADSSTLQDIAYASLVTNAYWYVIKSPSFSLYAPYTNITTTSMTYDSSEANITYSDMVVKTTKVDTTLKTEVWNVTYAKLESGCPAAPNVTMFLSCFRPDMPGRYELKLMVPGLYGDTYELTSPIVVEASCASALTLSKIGVEPVISRDGSTIKRITFDKDIISNANSANIAEFGMVVYGGMNIPLYGYNYSESRYYLEDPDYFYNGEYARIDFDAADEYSFIAYSFLAEFALNYTATDKCNWIDGSITIKNTDPVVPDPLKLTANGAGTIVGQDILKENDKADVTTTNFDGVDIVIEFTTPKVKYSDVYINFGSCKHPEAINRLDVLPDAGVTDKFTAGEIGGTVVGVLVGVALLVDLAVFVSRRREKTNRVPSNMPNVYATPSQEPAPLPPKDEARIEIDENTQNDDENRENQ